MKVLFLIIFLCVDFCSSQSISCSFLLRNGTYSCNLSITNPNGADNFELIPGAHLIGFGNADVKDVRRFTGTSSNVPRIICNQFENVESLTLSDFMISTLSSDALRGCQNLLHLDIYNNRLERLSSDVFVSNRKLFYLDLDANSLTSLDEDIFASLLDLEFLLLRNNPFVDGFPSGIFSNLTHLTSLYISNCRLTSIDPQWFKDLYNLRQLRIYDNDFTSIPSNAFDGLINLNLLDIGVNRIAEIPSQAFEKLLGLTSLSMDRMELTQIDPAWFQNLSRLVTLYLFSNKISSLKGREFEKLSYLRYLHLAYNPIESVAEETFSGLHSIEYLYLNDCRLRTLSPNQFANARNLQHVSFDGNRLQDIPLGLFRNSHNLQVLLLFGNRVRTVNRDSFGDLSRLILLDLQENVVNAVDARIIEDATRLVVLYFEGNLCASGVFDFSLGAHLEALSRCFRNHAFYFDTVTEADENFRFYSAPSPGIHVRVMADDEIAVALTPFDFSWRPMLEIFIGAANNTRSIVRRNQEEDVAVVPTPGIINYGQWNGFRISWANHVVMVFREDDEWPFIAFTMIDIVPVNFYGLRSANGRATWSLQPIN